MPLDGFSWLIEEKLAGMAHPGDDPHTFAELRAHGIGAVVGLTTEPLPEHLLKEYDLKYLHLPVPNFAPPTQSQITRFIRFCEQSLRAGRPVVVHCLAGMGRTGTMLACFLVWQGMSAEEAVRTVRNCRPASIETDEQENAVYEFASGLALKRDRSKRAGR